LDGNPITKNELEDFLTHYQDIHHNAEAKQEFALLDSACDTCAIGGSAWINQEHTGRNVDVTGHTLHKTSRTNIPIVSAITACDIPSGKTILLKLNETTNLGEHGNTLLSTIQMREHGVTINEIPRRYGGMPYLMADGYVIPLQLQNGLLQFPIRKPTKSEQHTCDEVKLALDIPWEQHELHDNPITLQAYQELCDTIPNLDDIRNTSFMWARDRPKEVHYAEPYLLYPGEQTTRFTLQNTTQLGTISSKRPLRYCIKSRNPLLN